MRKMRKFFESGMTVKDWFLPAKIDPMKEIFAKGLLLDVKDICFDVLNCLNM